MSGFLELRYSESSIKRFQKEILSQRIARLFFSMSFVNLKRETLAVVDTAEYVPIIAVESISFEKAVLLLISIIEKMFETENRYFYIGEYRIASKYIMYDPGTSDAVLLYSPDRSDSIRDTRSWPMVRSRRWREARASWASRRRSAPKATRVVMPRMESTNSAWSSW